MNLLDQLANFCPSPLCINLLDPAPRMSKQGKTGRPHSVLAASRVPDTRHSKSIDRLQSWAPSNKQEERKRIVFKLVRTLSNKARKNYFTFWVNCEQAIKNRLASQKGAKSGQGASKIAGFIEAYEAKQFQAHGLSKMFSRLVSYSRLKQTANTLFNALEPAIKRSQSSFMSALNQRQNMHLKMDFFLNSLQLMLDRKTNQKVLFTLLQYLSEPDKIKVKQEEKQVKLQASKIVVIFAQKLRDKGTLSKMEEGYSPIKSQQATLKKFIRTAADPVSENFPETCDSNLLFIQQPNLDVDQEQEKAKKTCSTEPNLDQACIQTKRGQQRGQSQFRSQIFNDEYSKKPVSLLETQLTTKKEYLTPKNRSISTSSIFNVDQSRLSKLENKLFGEGLKGSQFSVNGQDWKTDRKALNQIMCNIKSPERARRKSAYEIQLYGLQEKLQYYKDKALKNQRQAQPSTCDENGSFTGRAGARGAKIIGRGEECTGEKGKVQQKILISLKSKKKISSRTDGSSGKADQWQNVYQRERECRKLIEGFGR